jgi:hypothetical protein
MQMSLELNPTKQRYNLLGHKLPGHSLSGLIVVFESANKLRRVAYREWHYIGTWLGGWHWKWLASDLD